MKKGLCMYDKSFFDEVDFEKEYPIAHKFCRDKIGEDWIFCQAFYDTYYGLKKIPVAASEIDVSYVNPDNEDHSAVFLFDGNQQIIEYDLNNID